eukprot:5227898-Amphidinium_carterae.1
MESRRTSVQSARHFSQVMSQMPVLNSRSLTELMTEGGTLCTAVECAYSYRTPLAWFSLLHRFLGCKRIMRPVVPDAKGTTSCCSATLQTTRSLLHASGLVLASCLSCWLQHGRWIVTIAALCKDA